MRYVDDLLDGPGGRERAAASLLLAGITAFQVSLAAGAPWGRLAWGGGHDGVLPTDLRMASTGAAVGWGAVTVAVAWLDVTPPPLAVARFTIEPASMSACVIVCEDVQVTVAFGASVAVDGQVTVTLLSLTVNGPVRVTLPEFVTTYV